MEMIELIKKYILNELSDSEKIEFEQRLASDPKLRDEVLTQKQIMKGVERIAVKKSAGKAFKKYKLFKSLKIWGSAFLATAVVAGGILFFAPTSKPSSEVLYELNELGTDQWADADHLIPSQLFNVDPNQDTVIETDGGIIMAIPKGTWVDQNGKAIDGPIEIEVKEALNNASIMTAGLGTTSNGELLETGGMFYVNGRKDGESLKIKDGESISTSIPTDDYKAGMQLFDGERMPNGTVNWKNPTKIENYLQTVDIHSLNFYPPHYLDSVHSLGLDANNKVFTDSLYYSYVEEGEFLHKHNYMDSVVLYSSGSSNNGISPQRIQTIWSDEFQNTLLATTAFEQRLQAIHLSCDNSLIDLYISNLDQEMSYIDSLVVTKTSGEVQAMFKVFAAQNLGKVKDGDKHSNLLKRFYEKKLEAYQKAVKLALNKFNSENQKADEQYHETQKDFSTKEEDRKSDNLEQEFYINVCNACEQLGYNCKTPRRSVGYNFNVTNTGWKNVDRFVQEVWKSTANRETLDYTDSTTGKRAVIKYEPVKFEFQYHTSYDGLFVYLIPDSLNSFMRVELDESDQYTEKLNELMSYKMIAIGYKGEEIFYTQINDLMPKKYTAINLEVITKAKLNKVLNQSNKSSHSKAMIDEARTQHYFLRDLKRQKEVREIKELRERLRPVVFPCSCTCENDGVEVNVSYSYDDETDLFGNDTTSSEGQDFKSYPKLKIIYKESVPPTYTYLGHQLCVKGAFSYDGQYFVYQDYLGYSIHGSLRKSKLLRINDQYFVVIEGKVDEPLIEEELEE